MVETKLVPYEVYDVMGIDHKKREILNKHIPRMKVYKGSVFENSTYGKIQINDLLLKPWIGKDVEIDIVIREYDNKNE